MNNIWLNAVKASASAFVGAYDDIPDLVHLYEIARRGLSSYEGNLVRLRRSSDNAESDFGYDANGDLDTAAITTWLGGSSAFVVTIYDQVGSNNPTQATAGSQPTFVASGQNGKPVIRFSGTQYLQVAFPSLSQPTTIYAAAVATSVGAGSQFVIDGADGSNRNSIYTGGVGITWNIFAGAALLGATADTDAHLIAGLFNNTSSQSWKDGASMTTGTVGTQASAGVTVGARYSGTSGWPGDIFMIAIANPSHDDTERFAMETAITSYWDVFRFRITLISRGNDLGTAEAQGVAYDGTYYYFTASNTVYRYTRSGSTYTLDTSQSFAANLPAGATQINGMNIHDGYIWVGVSNFADEPRESWIMQIDLSTLTHVDNHALTDAHWTEGGAWNDVGAGDDFWAVFHDWDRVSRYRFVGATWTKIGDYVLPLAEGGTTNLYQGTAWYSDGTDDWLITQTHSANIPPYTHIHRWTGAGFEATASIPALDDNVGQGIHWETAGSVLLFSERDGGGNGQTIIRATWTDTP